MEFLIIAGIMVVVAVIATIWVKYDATHHTS